MKPEEFGFQLRVGKQWFHHFTMGSITMKSFNSGLKLNPGLKPNLKPDQILKKEKVVTPGARLILTSVKNRKFSGF